MGLISRIVNFTTGGIVYAAQINAELDNILTLVNGNITNANVDAAAGINISKTDMSTLAGTSLTIAATTHTRVYGSHQVRPWSTNPITVDDANNYALPTTADSAVDYGKICVDGIPPYAVITRLDVYGYTAAGGANTVSAELFRRATTGAILYSMASASFSDSGTTANDTTITTATIDPDYAYFLKIGVAAASATTNALFYAAKLTYTTNDLAQT